VRTDREIAKTARKKRLSLTVGEWGGEKPEKRGGKMKRGLRIPLKSVCRDGEGGGVPKQKGNMAISRVCVGSSIGVETEEESKGKIRTN